MVENRASQELLDNVGQAHIKVVGVGGGGVNAIRRMSGTSIPGVELLCVNTDLQSLEGVGEATAIPIGERVTRGLGAGGDPLVGLRAAEETREKLRSCLEGADLVFITAGMGGGTGTGAAPVVAAVAKEIGAITVAVVTTPFGFEGSKRMAAATAGLRPLRNAIDTLIVVSNDRLMAMASKRTSLREAFTTADQVMVQAILAVSRIINTPGEVNVDFADIRAVLAEGGTGLMAVGHGEGDHRLLKAARAAMANPLLDISAQGARSILFAVTGGPDLTLAEVNEVGALIADTADADAQIFFGMHLDRAKKVDREVELILIATRLPTQHLQEHPREPSLARAVRVVAPLRHTDEGLPPFLHGNGIGAEAPAQPEYPNRFGYWNFHGSNGNS